MHCAIWVLHCDEYDQLFIACAFDFDTTFYVAKNKFYSNNNIKILLELRISLNSKCTIPLKIYSYNNIKILLH